MSAAEWRRRWAYGLISRAQTPPARYGSPEWLALPDGPEKIASVVIAAEAWASAGDTLEETLRAQLDAERQAHKRAEDAEYVARRDAWKADWLPSGGFRTDPTEGDRIEREFREWVAQGGDAA